jgi:hypothetical protein
MKTPARHYIERLLDRCNLGISMITYDPITDGRKSYKFVTKPDRRMCILKTIPAEYNEGYKARREQNLAVQANPYSSQNAGAKFDGNKFVDWNEGWHGRGYPISLCGKNDPTTLSTAANEYDLETYHRLGTYCHQCVKLATGSDTVNADLIKFIEAELAQMPRPRGFKIVRIYEYWHTLARDKTPGTGTIAIRVHTKAGR